jgi:hypothetical protein
MAVLIGRSWNKRCRLIKDFDREMKEEEPRKTPETNKLLNEKKQALVSESYPGYDDHTGSFWCFCYI